MKQIITLFSLFVLFSIASQAQCCKNAAQASSCITPCAVAQNNNQPEIEAYYFHYSRRCATCMAVEEVSVNTLKELYGTKIVLKSINLDEKQNKELAKKVGVDGQSLIFIKGKKKVDITNDGFLYARTNPEKFKEKIKKTVESLK